MEPANIIIILTQKHQWGAVLDLENGTRFTELIIDKKNSHLLYCVPGNVIYSNNIELT